MNRPQVFGIGLSKTGTTSLARALTMLGYSTIHYPHDELTYEELTNARYRLSVLKDYDAAVGVSIAPFYAQFKEGYPGSRFVLSVRDPHDWLKSMQHHWPYMVEWGNRDRRFQRFTRFICACVYGAWSFDEDRFLHVYDTHNKNVRDYFAPFPGSLLVMDLCSGDGWDLLCPFLGMPIPDAPFPHLNKVAEKKTGREFMRLQDDTASDLAAVIPEDERFILVDGQQFGSEVARGRTPTPFLERDGRYWGPPPDGETAIRELERLRSSGSRFVAFAQPCFWWFEFYPELTRHLDAEYRCISRNRRLAVFDLTRPKQDPAS